MSVVGSDLFDTYWELFDNVIGKVYRVCLCVLVLDFEYPDARSVIDGGILEAADLFTALTDEGEAPFDRHGQASHPSGCDGQASAC